MAYTHPGAAQAPPGDDAIVVAIAAIGAAARGKSYIVATA